MAEKKHEQSSFTVTDRRLFTSDGDLRSETREENEVQKPSAPAAAAVKEVAAEKPVVGAETTAEKPVEKAEEKPAAAAVDAMDDREMPLPPTSAEQEAQAAAYRASSKDIDAQVELSGHSAKDFEITFERFMASLYMTAMMQLGLMRQPNEQPHVDIIGARQTIDTLSLISEKTKNNLTPVEQNFLQNSLYELRMAYVEVTNALARPPKAGAGAPTGPIVR
jgi:hypothetical protein